jgi:diguanylate cyclase (GGDEF)-like protein
MATDDDSSQSIKDPLTGAYSRGLLGPRLAEELSRASRSDTGCALFLFDLDYFKSINDAYGHQRGDQILCQLTDRVGTFIRGYDVLFRYGGDEFVLLLPDTQKADAVRVALRLTQGIKAEEFPGDPPLTVSVSLGVAAFPDDATDATELLAAADRRNYLAKHRGRACAVADDVETEARPASSRLLERDVPMGTTRNFLTRVAIGEDGALAVTGERGSGFSRFFEEVARAGRLRGYDVIAATDPAAVDPAQFSGPSDRPLLLVLDADLDRRVPALVAELRRPLGVVVRTPSLDGTAGPGLPVLDTVELHAWSSAAVRIWLRTTLQGEPDPVLVDWLTGRTGGLPARVEREIERLTERDSLLRGEHGGWSLSPALLTRSAPRRPLPKPLTELVGRQHETGQVAQLIAERRLVTLVGPGGIGKTRLSLAVATAVADTFPDGVLFVPLAAARTEAEVIAAIAQALDLAEVPGQALADTVAEHLADQSVLLVFDNFEQALDGAAALGDLLGAAPGVKVLASSREKLSLYGEQAYRVPALALPDLTTLSQGVPAALASSPALALFNVRARAAAFDFVLTTDNLAATAALCHRLDGLPLAIELAAAHSDMLSPAEILAQLTDRLDLPGSGPRGVPARQQTLRGAIDWSYTLLDPQDQDLLPRLGVFGGGCRLDAVQAVASTDQDPDELAKRLSRLADKSLVRIEPDPDEQNRYVLLETVRAYALERLDERPDAAAVRDAHALHFGLFATRAGAGLTGPDQAAWARRVQSEYQNLRAAFELAVRGAEPDVAVEVTVGLWRYWRNRGQFSDGREWLDRVLAGELTDGRRARVLHAAAVLAAAQDDHERASTLARESRERALTAGDQRTAAQAGNALGIAMLTGGRHAEARAVFAECLSTWQRLNDPHGTAMAHGNLAMVALRLGEVDPASWHTSECLRLERAQGNTRGIMLALLCLGEISIIRLDLDAAHTDLDEALALSRQIGDVFGEAMALHQLGLAALRSGDLRLAATQVAAGLGLRRDLGDRDDLSISLDTLAQLLATGAGPPGDVTDGPAAGGSAGGAPVLAARLLGAADGLRARHRLNPPSGPAAADRAATLTRLEVVLDPAAVAAARTTGAHASLDTIVNEALDYVQSTGRPA